MWYRVGAPLLFLSACADDPSLSLDGDEAGAELRVLRDARREVTIDPLGVRILAHPSL